MCNEMKETILKVCELIQQTRKRKLHLFYNCRLCEN